MESIVVAIITGFVALVGVIMSNSKSRAVMEVKIIVLAQKVEKHNRLAKRSYALGHVVALARSQAGCHPTSGKLNRYAEALGGTTSLCTTFMSGRCVRNPSRIWNRMSARR